MFELKLTVAVVASQNTNNCGLYGVIIGFGFTVIVYVAGGPAHVTPFNKTLGVIVTVPVTVDVVLLIAVNPGMLFVVPLIGVKPKLELLTFQE